MFFEVFLDSIQYIFSNINILTQINDINRQCLTFSQLKREWSTFSSYFMYELGCIFYYSIGTFWLFQSKVISWDVNIKTTPIIFMDVVVTL